MLIARLIPGARAMVFLAADVRAVPVWSLLRHDLLGASVCAPSILVIGHASGTRIGIIVMATAWVSRSAVWAITIASILLVF